MQHNNDQWIQVESGLFLPESLHNSQRKPERQAFLSAPQKGEQKDDWLAHWEAHGQSWRTEPEINAERQQFLLQRLEIIPDDKKQVYPFKDVPLTRADVEWLVRRQEERQASVNEIKEQLQGKIDLQGAILDTVKLSMLKLEGANFAEAKLKRVDFSFAQLKGANFISAQLEGADFQRAQLEGALFMFAQLRKANFGGAKLKKADFTDARLEGAFFVFTELKGADFKGIQLKGANFNSARLEGADFGRAKLKGAVFNFAKLKGADFHHAQLERADFREAQLEEANFWSAKVANAQFEGAVLVTSQGVGPTIADSTGWDEIPLAKLEWPQIRVLGDEVEAKKNIASPGGVKGKARRLEEYRMATRAYRQFANVLEGQGLKEEAELFAYRAQVMQRKVFWWHLRQEKQSLRHQLGHLRAWLFSWLLSLVSGYSYQFERSLGCYLGVLFSFACLYIYLSQSVPPHSGIPDHLSWLDAAILSVSDMVGRGFFRQDITLSDPYAAWSVLEGVIGVFMDVLLISTLTQRLFKK